MVVFLHIGGFPISSLRRLRSVRLAQVQRIEVPVQIVGLSLFQYLSVNGLVQARCVCKGWRAQGSISTLWKTHCDNFLEHKTHLLDLKSLHYQVTESDQVYVAPAVRLRLKRKVPA